MMFTKKRPTKPGWYWIYGLMKFIENEPNMLYCTSKGWFDARGGYFEPFKDGLLFDGPISPPDLPETE